MSSNLDFIYSKTIISSDSTVSEPFISYGSNNPQEEFDNIQKCAVHSKGLVMPRLNESFVDIVEVEPHDFNSDKPLVEAQQWAEKNLINTYVSHKRTSCEFKYEISKKALKKYLDPSSTNKSENISVHLSALKKLPEIIDASIEVEIHADYTKVNGVRSVENPVNDNVLIHRFFGAIMFESKLHRIKTTIYEYRDINYPNKPYTFEVIKIELLDYNESNSSTSAPNHPNSQGGLIIRVAKLLQNIEKSYDKGKFLLNESL
ncbi:MAG: hypothetical protein IKA83_01610 [Paludibacteraceae bacterium]|nr:hypothetical protein [Paludibacteraceae bacterium]